MTDDQGAVEMDRAYIPVNFDPDEVDADAIRDYFHECTHMVDHTEIVFSDDVDVKDSEFKHDPVRCTDCGEFVVVTRNRDADFADEDPRFECGCSVGVMAARKPDSWEGGDFL